MRMAGFGYKTGWLAIRNGDLRDVVNVLGGRVVGAGDWQQGVDRAYEEADIVVATPLLDGSDGERWLLVAGQWVALNRHVVDVAALSAALDREVQLFVTHRVVEGHGWERAVGGTSIRSFEYVDGEVTRWHGAPQEVELAIGFPAPFDIERDAVSDNCGVAVREDDVMRVAASWSVDPTVLDGRPASEPLTVAQLPLGHVPDAGPVGKSMVVDITDLISSGGSYEDFQAKLASRLQERAEAAPGDESQ
jgi:hypothetical protein